LERTEIIVLDTHTWIWWISDPNQLSKEAKKTVDEAAAASAIYISSISVWEITMLVSRGRLQLTMEVEDWISRCESLPFLNFAPVDNLIARKANNLPNYNHRDPADRMIIATAITLSGVLISKDPKIRNYSGVSSVW
jgi:PIN domain nuclease of toxin-antitoxin system